MTMSIVTTFIGPTNTKGARIRAKAHEMRPITVNYTYDGTESYQHARAALALRDALDWAHLGEMVGAHLNGSSMVWVFKTHTANTASVQPQDLAHSHVARYKKTRARRIEKAGRK